MNLKQVIKEQKSRLKPINREFTRLKKEASCIIKLLRNEIKSKKIKAEPFLGGSFAKKTMLLKNDLDIDIFIRFSIKINNISDELEKILIKIAGMSKLKMEKIHGSRDYFRIIKDNIKFEIIPVYKINRPQDARNVTDLSYFHVNYIKRRLNSNLAEEIIIAKKFCQAQDVYGAESYINGFSGYSLECLIIYYKTFEKMLKSLAFAKEKILIDMEKKYKKKSEMLFQINEAKLHSPIILVDPTFKERNVLAALSKETFGKFQAIAKKFLKFPAGSFFEIKEFNIENFNKIAQRKKAEFINLKLFTEKQDGSIAGTKLKKFSNFFRNELSKYFEVLKAEFFYSGSKSADFYLILKSKKEIIIPGPPEQMDANLKLFKKKHKTTFMKNKIVYAKEKTNFSASEYIKNWAAKNIKKVREMSVSKIEKS